MASAILQWNVRDRSTAALGNEFMRPFPSMFDVKEPNWLTEHTPWNGGPGYTQHGRALPGIARLMVLLVVMEWCRPLGRWDFGGLERWRAGYW